MADTNSGAMKRRELSALLSKMRLQASLSLLPTGPPAPTHVSLLRLQIDQAIFQTSLTKPQAVPRSLLQTV